MKDKIEELKVVYENIGVMISMLEGEFPKKYLTDGGTVQCELNCFNNEGGNLQRVIDSIIDEHGSDLMLTCD